MHKLAHLVALDAAIATFVATDSKVEVSLMREGYLYSSRLIIPTVGYYPKVMTSLFEET